MTRDNNVPDAKASSPDGARIAGRPDVLAELKRQAAIANADMPSKPLPAAADLHADGTDEHGHTPGYDLTVARMAARFSRQPVFGRPPAAAWRGDALAQDAVQQLAGVKKAKATPREVEDDPTGAAQTLATLKRLHEGGSASPPPPRTPVTKAQIRSLRSKLVDANRVRKANGQKEARLPIYDSGRKLRGVMDPEDLKDEGSMDEAAYDVNGRQIGFVDDDDITPAVSYFEASRGQQGYYEGRTDVTPSASPQKTVPAPAPAATGPSQPTREAVQKARRILATPSSTPQARRWAETILERDHAARRTVRKARARGATVDYYVGDRLIRTERQ